MSRQRIYVRLKGKGGRFYDPATKFRIKLDEVQELTYPLGELTRQWLNAGGLVIEPTNTLPPQEAPGIISKQPDMINVNKIEQSIKLPEHDEYSYMSVIKLRGLAKKRRIKISRTDTAEIIRNKLRKA